MSDIRETIRDYYSNITVKTEGRMATKVCSCGSDSYPAHVRPLLAWIPPEIEEKAYGCGSPIPLCLEGCTVLDLGCGTGKDVYLASMLAGPKGRVIGVDMNKDQLAVAQKYQDEMAKRAGFSNTEFIEGYIEDLESSGIEDCSIDVVISNCVINLSPAKEEVFREVWRVLKPGGELYFSDIFADRRVPDEINKDPLLLGECMGGAMYIEDFRRLMRRVGWEDFRYVSSRTSVIDNRAIERLTEGIGYTSRTVRAFKLPDYLEDICEQYGQAVIYKGGIAGAERFFTLDDHHTFEKGLISSVCGNTCAMLQNTRFAPYFEIIGDRSRHFGPFPGCGNAPAANNNPAEDCGCGCC